MTDTLLFLHLLAAAGLFASIATFSAVAFGAVVDSRSVAIANVTWGISLIAVLLLGIALAIDIDGYELWDAWVLLAIVLWLAAGGAGDAAQRSLRDGAAAVFAMDSRARTAHWIRVALVVLLLADMVWKPWA